LKVKHSYHLFVILNENREDLMNYLSSKGIETLIHYPIPFYKSRAFQEYNTYEFKNAEFLSSRILSIPIHTSISQEDLDIVLEAFKNYNK
jgi:dTDP-4-amino-4,6-dideoxygalactose transaminase